jgi:uncharacterized membrane protein YphA (DoxX/SURF4 family)/cytochrome oxidase Cu insertion factor (SCO1/SenC/PrrC family)
MEIAVLIARLILFVVFAVAGVTKLADKAGSREGLQNFGVPAKFAYPLGILLPFAEFAVALALLPVASAWWAAVGALALLLIFMTVIGFNLARGRKPNCRCFGQLHSKPVGWSTLTRNGILAGLASVVISQTPSSAGPSITGIGQSPGAQHISVLVLAMVLLLLFFESVVLMQIVKQQGRMLRRLELTEAQFTRSGNFRGLAIGAPAPAFALPNLNGEEVTLDGLRSKGVPVLLVFSDPQCSVCDGLAAKIANWQREHADKLTLAIVSHGSVEANRAKPGAKQVQHLLLQQDHEVDDAYLIDGTPAAVLVRPDGSVGSPQAATEDMIESIVVGIVGQLGPNPLLAAAAAKRNGTASQEMPGLVA